MSSLLHVRINIERNQTFDSKPPKLIRLVLMNSSPNSSHNIDTNRFVIEMQSKKGYQVKIKQIDFAGELR